MNEQLNNLFAVSMALNDLTFPKTTGVLNATETQRLRHRLLALGCRYTGDKSSNIFTHIASESKRLYHETDDVSKGNDIELEKQIAQLHAKLGAGLNVVAQSHGSYDPTIQMESLSSPRKTQQISKYAFRVLEKDPRPLIQSWAPRINNQSALILDEVFTLPASQVTEFEKKIRSFQFPEKMSLMGEDLLSEMNDLYHTPLKTFEKNREMWKIGDIDIPSLVIENTVPIAAIVSETPWLDVVNNLFSGINFVSGVVSSILADNIMDSVIGLLLDFAIDFVLDSCTLGLWTIGKFIISIFTGGLF